MGGEVLSSFPKYRTVYALLPLAKMETLAARRDVQFIGLPPKMQVHDIPAKRTSANEQPALWQPLSRSVASVQPAVVDKSVNDPEGDATTGAAAVRAQYGVTGAGVKIGVLSDSIDDGMGSYQAALSAGYVPTVTVVPNQAGTGSGEGLAMLEIVHRIAPQAQLYFAGPSGSEEFGQDVEALQADGCTVILDDLGFNDENPFQDGPAALGVVAITAKGALFFSAIGNSGNFDSGMSSCWEGDFVSTSNDGFLDLQAGTGNPVNELETVTAGDNMTAIDLFWAEPEGAVTSQYNLYEVDPTGAVVQEASDDVTASERPFQSLANVTAGNSIKVQLASGTPRFLHLDTPGDNITFSVGTAGHGLGHSAMDAVNSFSVAATPAAAPQPGNTNLPGPYPNEFTAANAVEPFSDDGPRRMFFKPDGTPYTPGNFSSTGGQVFAKPDFTTADGVTTSATGFDPFFGTSAAAPHAGALAALALSYDSTLTPAQAATALVQGTVQIAAPGPDNRDAGAGILLAPNIFAAIPTSGDPVISSPLTASGEIGQPFSYQIVASNTPTSYAATGAPAGLTLNPTTGLLSGTPTVAGTFPVALTATNDSGRGVITLTLTVASLPVVTLAATTPTVTLGSGEIGEFMVTLSAPQTEVLIVNYTLKGSGVNGEDYVFLKGTKKFNPGITSKPIKIEPLGDLGGEPKKSVKVTLAPGTGYTVGTTTFEKVLIVP